MFEHPLWFKIFLGFFSWTIVTGTFRRFVRAKYVARIKASPADQRDKFRSLSAKILLMIKIMLYCAPLNLLALPYLVYQHDHDIFIYLMTALVIMYILLIDEYTYRRYLLKSLKDT